MTRTESSSGLELVPRRILIISGAYLVLGLFALYVWHSASQAFSMQVSSDSTNALSVTGMAVVELWLCVLVLRSFPSGAPLRPAWILITLSAVTRAAYAVIAPVLGTYWLLNPLVWAGKAESGLMEQIRQCALIAGGPIEMALLGAGLLMALRVLRRFGFWVRPSAADWVLVGVVSLFMLYRFGEAVVASQVGRHINTDAVIALAGYPLLCGLFLEALLLRRSIARMGRGLATKCWAAFMIAIFITTAGQMIIWAMQRYATSWPVAAIEWYVWFPAAVGFALAPAYQLAAQCRATQPASPRPAGFLTDGFQQPRFGSTPAA